MKARPGAPADRARQARSGISASSAAGLTAKRRKEIAKKAAQKRWEK